jgi:hypothetical protein
LDLSGAKKIKIKKNEVSRERKKREGEKDEMSKP